METVTLTRGHWVAVARELDTKHREETPRDSWKTFLTCTLNAATERTFSNHMLRWNARYDIAAMDLDQRWYMQK